MRNFALSIKARVCDYRDCESRSSPRRLRMRTFDRGVVVVSRVLFVEARSSSGMEGEPTLLAMKTHKNLKTFLTGQVCLVIRTSPSRCCKKFPLCLRDCRTVFASRQEMHLHNVLTSQATAWNGFFSENIYAVNQLFNGPLRVSILKTIDARVIAL